MKESELLGTLIPTRPDLFPTVLKMREKYNLPKLVSTINQLKKYTWVIKLLLLKNSTRISKIN